MSNASGTLTLPKIDPGTRPGVPIGSGNAWRSAAGTVLALSIVVSLFLQAGSVNVALLLGQISRSPFFWLSLAGAILVSPAIDWLILRRLWNLSPAGLVPLLQKQAANEAVFGYSGDAQFYLWARDNAAPAVSPFETLRDLSVLSALAGNLATLLLMALTYPVLRALVSGPLMSVAIIAVAIVVGTSIAIFVVQRLLFRFSLSKPQVAGVLAAFLVRIALSLFFTSMLWSMLVPGVAAGTLLLLATVRMMLSRVPFLPGKEAVFAGVTLFLMHDAAALAHAVAVVSALLMSINLLLCGGALIGGGARATKRLSRERR